MRGISLTLVLELLKTAALLAVLLFFYGDVRAYLAGLKRWQAELCRAAFFVVFTIVGMKIIAVSAGGTLVNFRSEAVLLAAIFGGPVAGLAAAGAGILVREFDSVGNTALGILIVMVSFLIGFTYRHWIDVRGRRMRYLHLVGLGIALDLGRVGAWLVILGYRGMIDSVDSAWSELLIIFPVTLFALGATVLLAEERKALTHAIADSEARFRSVLDQLPFSLTLTDRDDRYTFVNRTQAEWTGLPASEQIGKPRHVTWSRATGGPVPQALEDGLAAGRLVSTPPTKLNLANKTLWAIGTIFPVRNARGEVTENGLVGLDVTELYTTREAIARRDEMLQRLNTALYETMRKSDIGTLPLVETIRGLTETAGNALGVGRTGVFRFDLDAEEVERLDLWDSEPKTHLPRAILSRPMQWRGNGLLDGNEVLLIEDTTHDSRAAPLIEYIRAHDIGAMMTAAIYAAGHFRGVVTFSHVGGPRAWSAEEIAFARSIADILAIIFLNDRYREALAALDLIEDGIYIEDAHDRLIYGNRVAFAMARGPKHSEPQQLPLKSLPAMFPRPARPLQGETDHYETTLDLGNDHRDIQIMRRRLPDGGIIALIRDMTLRNRAQRERERLESQLVQASKLEAIGQLAGGIAHDFNNLLGAMLGFARFIEEDLPAESKQHQYAGRIIAACERGKAIVTQVNSFARARNIERSAVDLAALLPEIRDLSLGLIKSTIDLTLEISEPRLPTLANSGQVTQLLVNLIANANDAIEGTGKIAVSVAKTGLGEAIVQEEEHQLSLFDGKYVRRRVFGQLDPAREYARIDVSDTGKGISPKIVQRIFEPFFTSKRRTGGTGLGLSVVQSIVNSHEGVLYLDSAERLGTTFSIYLPLIAAAEAEIHLRGVAARNEGTERVLIVDDDVDVADMLSIGLARVGYEVAVSNDPLEALEAFTEDPQGWDIAIIDRMMPEMSGIELAQHLRAIRGDLRIILCTGLDDGTIEPQLGSQAFDLFFIKPVAPDQVAGGIRRLFE
ncbi:MAG TPA: ATP-binding protein [Stellaceae bacterium]|jgi:PAS domain S-box-containing protein|nr:ATP-binding protein [Stellaceae bacterium]